MIISVDHNQLIVVFVSGNYWVCLAMEYGHTFADNRFCVIPALFESFRDVGRDGGLVNMQVVNGAGCGINSASGHSMDHSLIRDIDKNNAVKLQVFISEKFDERIHLW